MANKRLFGSYRGQRVENTDAVNEAGGSAYQFGAKHALAQYAATGCLNSVFYASAEQQLDRVLSLCADVEPEFVARTAVYSRRDGAMKDLPALLCAVLAVRAPQLLETVFDEVIDSAQMMRTFVQIVRSGVVGRKSLGSLPKRLVRKWLDRRSDEQLFRDSIGRDPSLVDVIKMVHPKPLTATRDALYGYLLKRDHDPLQLPRVIRDFEVYKRSDDRRGLETPDVPFRMLTALGLEPWEWKAIARNAPWQMTRMNLNTLLRHGVFEDRAVLRLVADRLRDRELIARSRVFPYQLLVAYLNVARDMPPLIREALQDALDVSLANVPRVEGKVYVLPDISGSMHSSLTGYRRGATSAVRCLDVAALVAAALVRTNPDAEVIAFESKAVPVALNPRDSVATNATLLAQLPCGGTNCSAPLQYLNEKRKCGDLVIYLSDNESWIDSPHYGHWGGGATQTMKEWSRFKSRSPEARMICIDMQPYETTQAQERDDIVNVGGFSDRVFDLIAAVGAGRAGQDHWVTEIESVELHELRSAV
ncbi:MAG: TROVE domain-containing protein [Planctomycetota bacterium]